MTNPLPFPVREPLPTVEAKPALGGVEIEGVCGGGGCRLVYKNEQGGVEWTSELSHRFSFEQVLWVRKMMQKIGDDLPAEPSRRPLLGPRLLP